MFHALVSLGHESPRLVVSSCFLITFPYLKNSIKEILLYPDENQGIIYPIWVADPMILDLSLKQNRWCPDFHQDNKTHPIKQISTRVVEMDSGLRTGPFIHKKCRTRTQRIRVRKNADSIESDPLDPRSA